MKDSKHPVSAGLAVRNRAVRFGQSSAAIALAATLLFLLVYPSMFAGIMVLVALLAFLAPFLGRQYAKHASKR